MSYKFLLFDLDHTLMDFDAAEEVALSRMLADLRVDDIHAYKAYYKPMNQQMWRDLEAGRISKKELVTTRFARLFAHFGREVDGSELAGLYQDQLAQQGQLYPGAAELLEELGNRGYTLYAATNGIIQIQVGRLAASGLAANFSEVFISEQAGTSKPEPAFYDYVASRIPAFERSAALMIGDNLAADVLGGNRAGIDTVWYNPGRTANTSSAIPTYTVATYQELADLL